MGNLGNNCNQIEKNNKGRKYRISKLRTIEWWKLYGGDGDSSDEVYMCDPCILKIESIKNLKSFTPINSKIEILKGYGTLQNRIF